MSRFLFLPRGAVFGFILSRAGATTHEFYAGLFLLQDPQLALVIGTAVVVGLPGVWLLERRGGRTVSGGPIGFERKPMKPGLVLGSLLFGAGWGLAGACPGTALAMLGEGRMAAAFTILGAVLGTWLYGVQEDLRARRASSRPEPDAARVPTS